MINRLHAVGIEVNPKLIGVLLTDQVANTLRIFCFYTSGRISQFDVPAEENRDSRHELFSALNIEQSCSSVIVDEAVQGRIYVQADNDNERWLYTVLKSPGSQLPLNADIADLPWKVIWRSSEMEALQYQPADGAAPSFALRSKIKEHDAARLLKNSHSFTNPVSPRAKKPRRWLYLTLGLALLALAVVVGATTFYTFKKTRVPQTVRVSPVKITAHAAPAAPAGYFLLYNHQISGPFPAKVVADMNAAGLFPPGTMCRTENATTWVELSAAFPSSGPPPPPQPSAR